MLFFTHHFVIFVHIYNVKALRGSHKNHFPCIFGKLMYFFIAMSLTRVLNAVVVLLRQCRLVVSYIELWGELPAICLTLFPAVGRTSLEREVS